MKYQSELIAEIVEKRGHEMSSLHYESECIQTWIDENKGAYPKLCDYQSEWLNYINENPIGDFPYETLTDITEATVNNVVPYSYKSAILKGMTLVNVVKEYWFVDSTNYFGIELNQYRIGQSYMFIMFDAPSNITQICVENGDGSIKWSDYTSEFTRNKNYVMLKVTCPSNYNGSSVLSNLRYLNGEQPSSINNIKCMLIEYQDGMENWDIPYFTGMQSVKMPVLTTTGKNLLDFDALYEQIKNLHTVSKTEDGITIGEPSYTNGKVIFTPKDTSKRYVASFKTTDIYGVVLNFNYTDGTYSNIWGNENGEVSTQGKTVKDICFTYATPVTSTIRDIIIEEYTGDAHTYEPYKSNILTVNEDVELRGIGNVQDELDLLSGELTERIGEIVLDGSEGWWHYKNVETMENTFCLSNVIVSNILGNGVVISNSYSNRLWHEMVSINPDKTIGNADNKAVYITDKSCSTLEEFTNYLQQRYINGNPVIIQYPLSEKSIKTVDLSCVNQNGENVKFKPIEGTMHIATDGTPIKPTFTGEIPVEAITQNLASFIEE